MGVIKKVAGNQERWRVSSWFSRHGGPICHSAAGSENYWAESISKAKALKQSNILNEPLTLARVCYSY